MAYGLGVYGIAADVGLLRDAQDLLTHFTPAPHPHPHPPS